MENIRKATDNLKNRAPKSPHKRTPAILPNLKNNAYESFKNYTSDIRHQKEMLHNEENVSLKTRRLNNLKSMNLWKKKKAKVLNVVKALQKHT